MNWALELAENANTYTPLGANEERILTERYVLWLGRRSEPAWNVAQRFRLRSNDVEQVHAEIRGHLRERGRSGCTWEVGSSATPGELVDRLYELGLVDDEPTSLAVGMVLTRRPAGTGGGVVEVRRVETPAERRASARIAAVAFGGPGPTEAPTAARDPNNIEYLAFVDGEPVARASAAFGEHGATLFGGATLPAARGRGAYRALVTARWEEAAQRGTPLVVTQAGPMSRPILARLGFREVCKIRILLDDFAAESAV